MANGREGRAYEMSGAAEGEGEEEREMRWGVAWRGVAWLALVWRAGPALVV